MMAECTSKNNIRGIVHGYFSILSDQFGFYQLSKNCSLRLIVEPESCNRYQGIVLIYGKKFSSCLQYYFEQPVRNITKIKVGGYMRTAVGMRIRKLPALTSNDEESQELKEKSLLLEILRN